MQKSGKLHAKPPSATDAHGIARVVLPIEEGLRRAIELLKASDLFRNNGKSLSAIAVAHLPALHRIAAIGERVTQGAHARAAQKVLEAEHTNEEIASAERDLLESGIRPTNKAIAKQLAGRLHPDTVRKKRKRM